MTARDLATGLALSALLVLLVCAYSIAVGAA